VVGYQLELLRGLGAWCTPLLVAVGLYVAYTQLDDGAVWSYVTGAVTTGALLMGPLAAGVAAFTGSRSARRGVAAGELLGARHVLSAPGAALAAVLTWTMTAYAVVVAVLFIPCAVQANWGGPSWLWVGSAGLGIAASVCVGFAAGRLLPWRFTPVVVAVGAFLIDAFVETGSGWTVSLSPAAERLLLPFDDVRRGLLGGQALWYAGLIVAALGAVAVAARARRRETSAIVVTAVILLGTGATVVHAEGPAFASYPPLRWVCTGNAPQVCVHPAFAHALGMVQARADGVADRLAGTPFAITRVEQHPRGARWEPTPGAVSFGLDSLHPDALQQAMLEMAAGAMGYPDSCYTRQTSNLTLDLTLIVVSWAAGYPQRPDAAFAVQRSAYDRFAALSAADHKAWLTAHATAIRDCALAPADFS